MHTRLVPFVISALTVAALLCVSPALAKGEVNIYSAQKEHLIRPILDSFTKQTDIKVNMTSGEDEVIVRRLLSEGELTPADVLLTADIGNIWKAKEAGALKALDSKLLKERIPAHLRDKDGYWYGLTVRARALFYAKDRLKPEQLSTYKDLADPKWKGKILVRSSSNIYNQSLLGSIITHEGHDQAKAWAKGIVANMARTPQGGDRDQLKALAVGEGEVAIANTYYFGLLLSSADKTERKLASKLGIFFPNQEERGTHVNIRGGGVIKYGKNQEEAVKLMEFLAGDEAQAFFATHNNEYPAVETVAVPNLLKSWGEFKHDTLNLEEVGKRNAEAVKLFDEVGWK